MLRIFGRRSKKIVYPARRCHFCNVESYIIPPHPESILDSPGQVDSDESKKFASTSASAAISSSLDRRTRGREEARLSTGSIANWFCSSCQCWNRVDENEIGGISSWEVAMSDEKKNAVTPTRALSTPSSSPYRRLVSSKEVSPFCHSCQTNQTLILSILANMSQEEMDTMSEEEMMAWQVSLEERYPPVCEQCQDIVKTKIERADKIARRLIWNGWLRKTEERKRRMEVTEQKGRHEGPPAEGGGGDNYHSPSDSIGIFWLVQLFGFASTLVIATSTIWYSSPLGSYKHSARLVVFCACHLVTRNWDLTLPQRLRMRQRHSPDVQLKVEGLSDFRSAQVWLFVIGILDQLLCSNPWWTAATKTGVSSNVIGKMIYLSSLLVCLQLVIAYTALRRLRVIEPYSISLKTRPLPTSLPGTPVKKDSSTGRTNESTALNFLSLNDDNNKSFYSPSRQGKMHSAVKEYVAEEVQMDWAPAEEERISSSAKIDRDFQLGPQRFFEPVRKTGLEDLFGQRLALSDRPAVDDRLTTIMRGNNKLFLSSNSLFWSSTIFVAFLALLIAFSILLAPDPHRTIFTQLYLYGRRSARHLTTQAFSLPQRLLVKLFNV